MSDVIGQVDQVDPWDQLLKAVDNHGVALAILVDGLDSPRLRIQCECGWHASFGEVITFDAVFRSVNDHIAAVAKGNVT